MTDHPPITPAKVTKWTGVSVLVLVALIALILGSCAGIKSFNRYQTRADAKNNVKVSHIEIDNQEQRIEIAVQKAEIRRQDAIGIREAQEEIAKTLTPLYVQFEMVEALKSIAVSGQNNSLVYIPVGANGIPLISNAAGQVGNPGDD